MHIDLDHQEPTYQFYLSEIDAHILLENHAGDIILRTSSRNLSESCKSKFIQYLAAEGFIPGRYQWQIKLGLDEIRGLVWIVDSSWLRLPSKLSLRTNRIMRRALISAGTLWLGMIAIIILRAS